MTEFSETRPKILDIREKYRAHLDRITEREKVSTDQISGKTELVKLSRRDFLRFALGAAGGLGLGFLLGRQAPEQSTHKTEVEPAARSFEELFERLEGREIDGEPEETSLIKRILTKEKELLLSENAGRTTYNGVRRTGKQLSLVMDSQDGTQRAGLIAVLQGGGVDKEGDPKKDFVRAVIIDNITTDVALINNVDDKWTNFTSARKLLTPEEMKTIRDTFEIVDFEIINPKASATHDNMLRIEDVLANGKVNEEMTRGAANSLEILYNTPIIPRAPVPKRPSDQGA